MLKREDIIDFVGIEKGKWCEHKVSKASLLEYIEKVREMKDKIIEWVIIIIVAIVLFVISDKVSVALDMNRRSARYLILAVVAFVYWIIDIIRNKK